MKKQLRVLSLLALVPTLAVTACNKSNTPAKINADPNKISYTADDLVQQSFGGLGVEWGAYEDIDKLAENGWDRVIKNMDQLKAARVRVMINYDWYVTNFDNKGTKDKTDDTWDYNFANKTANNLFTILEYCQTHDVEVAFGAWNVIGDFSNDVWGMMDEVTSDIRWAKITGDVLDFLVHKKGFTCIKWFVNSNEPNYKGYEGSSKNYNNTFEIWSKGVKNVRKTLDDLGLNWIGIVGGDTTGFEGTQEYLLGIAKNFPTEVGDYGCHLYLSNRYIDQGVLFQQVDDLYGQIKKLDPGLGTDRQANVWEAGLLDGKNGATDCQTTIATVDYAIRMGDYTLQCLAGGINGICYWDFDDGMHFMYSNNEQTPKEWGMFSSLAQATAEEQELRPWYHSSCLLTHLFKKGNRVYSPLQNDPSVNMYFRSLATISPDGKHGGFAAVNASAKMETKTFYIDEHIDGDKLYVYNFAEGTYKLGEDGFIIPNQIINGTLNKKITMKIPSNSMVVVSNERL